MSTPTKAAMRAANVIAPEKIETEMTQYNELITQSCRNTVAKIIDRETRLPEIIEALEQLYTNCCASDFNEHWDCYTKAEQILKEIK